MRLSIGAVAASLLDAALSVKDAEIVHTIAEAVFWHLHLRCADILFVLLRGALAFTSHFLPPSASFMP